MAAADSQRARFVCPGVVIGLALVLVGCGAQLGGAIGIGNPPVKPGPEFDWGAQLGAYLVQPPEQEGWVGGLELQGTAGSKDGTRWFAGVQAGYAWAPSPRRMAVGYEIDVDGGSEFSDGTLFRDTNLYFGITGSLLLYLGEDHFDETLNDRMRVFVPIPMLVLSLRPRLTHPIDCADKCWLPSLPFQIAIRTSFETDYF